MKATKIAVAAAAKPVAKSDVLSKEQRSSIARAAAKSAWATMRSKKYIAAAAKGPAAVKSFLAAR